MKYIDVSEHQGIIDWEKVKGNVDGAIIRAGYGKGHIDKQFHRNAEECNRLGIPCGAYWFSYASTPEMARLEAVQLLQAVRQHTMMLPMAYDFEYDSVRNVEKNNVTVTKALATKMVYAFCETVEAAGYWCLNYANPDFLSRYFDETVPMRFGLWLAAWPTFVDVKKPPRKCAIWQWTSKGSVPGISGNVDISEAYTDFKTLIASNGMNNLGFDDGEGGAIYEHTQQTQQPVKPDALQWARNQGLCGDVAADTPVTWKEFAEAMYKLHGPQDGKTDSGLLSD